MANHKQLAGLIAYCRKHPEENFWEAVRNWSGFEFLFVGELEAGDNEISLSRFELYSLVEHCGLKEVARIEGKNNFHGT